MDSKKRLALVEVEISNKGFDAKKYKLFQWEKYFPVKPELIVISLKPVSVEGYNVTNINA